MMLKERTNRWARLKLLLVVPVMAGTLYAFARPEVKETFIAATDGIRQAEPENDYRSLKEFFRKEREAFMARIQKTGFRSKAYTLRVNKDNQILLNTQLIKLEDLQDVLEKEFSYTWKNSSIKYAQCLTCHFDAAASQADLGKIYQKVKNAYLRTREMIASETSNNSQAYLDSVCPIAVYEKSPQHTTGMQANGVITGVSLVFHDSANPQQKLKLTNFTLKDLKKEVAKWKAASGDTEGITVELKVDKDCPMDVVKKIKNVLREATVLKINNSR